MAVEDSREKGCIRSRLIKGLRIYVYGGFNWTFETLSRPETRDEVNDPILSSRQLNVAQKKKKSNNCFRKVFIIHARLRKNDKRHAEARLARSPGVRSASRVCEWLEITQSTRLLRLPLWYAIQYLSAGYNTISVVSTLSACYALLTEPMMPLDALQRHR